MEAKIKESYRFDRMQLFSGHEYVKFAWHPVPPGHEAEALAEESLEVRETPVIVEKKGAPESMVPRLDIPKPILKPGPKPQPGSRRSTRKARKAKNDNPPPL